MNASDFDNETATVLVVDDEKELHYSFQRLLTPLGYRIRSAESRAEAMEALSYTVDLVLLDVRLGDENGLDVLKEIVAARPHLPVIVNTAYGTTDTAIEATRRGAYDYVLKPFDPPQFLRLVREAVRAGRAVAHNVALPGDRTQKEKDDETIVGSSPAMQNLYKTIGRIADTDALALLLGESGTGKELVARAIYSHSKRRNMRFLPINCAALPESLLESGFGHERGAFSGAVERRLGKFEQAEGGTVFLDEIGELPPPTQAKLLRFLQDQTFQRVGGRDLIRTDVRIIAATNQDLDKLVEEGSYRSDLLYRLKVVTIPLPPLRERREDISELVDYFIARYAQRPVAVSDAAMEVLSNAGWPGNVRQLENTVRRALLLARGTSIEPQDIDLAEKPSGAQAAQGEPGGATEERGGIDLAVDGLWRSLLKHPEVFQENKTFHWLECELAQRAIETTNGNQVQAAKLLGVSRNTLRQRLGM